MMNRLQVIDKKLAKIRSNLEKLPPGKLIYSKTGKYIKWYQKNGKEKKYIDKSERSLAEKLALKKYFQLIEQELLNEKKAILLYREQIDANEETAEKFLMEKSEYQSLLNSQFVPRSKELEDWMNASYEKNPYHPENLIHKSISGNIVRSKSEAIIDMILHTNKIPFRYECVLKCGNTILYPDFTIRHPVTGEVYYWEHFGLAENKKYMEDMLSKLRTYITNGIIPGAHLIMTFETKEEPFTSDLAEKIVGHYFL